MLIDQYQNISGESFYNVGVLIAEGSQGEVYHLAGEPDKVIKFSSLDCDIREVKIKRDKRRQDYLDVMDFLNRNNYDCFPRVYDFGICDVPNTGSKLDPSGFYEPAHYCFSIVQKLKEISPREQFLMEELGYQIESRNSNFEDIKNLIERLIDGRQMTVDIDRIMNFYTEIVCMPINHNDMAGCNFMRDANCDYKLIDFDRATLM